MCGPMSTVFLTGGSGFIGGRLIDRLVADGAAESHLRDLSMGMSHDFEVAIDEGATIVRVGTAIFGRRTPPPPEDK